MPLVDALKGVAAQIILLHHLVSYGPLARVAARLWPAAAGWLFDYGRMAVQVFLVVAGFLAARSLAMDGVPRIREPFRLIGRRYARLMPPFLTAVLLSLVVALLADRWLDDDAIPEVHGLWQFVAHGLLLHGIFDVPSLSVGVWYVAIDFQLYAMLVLLLWLATFAGGNHGAGVAAGLVAVAAVASLFGFNRDPALDDWGIYFFGSYALGVFAWWLAERRRPFLWLAVPALVALAALAVDFRLRIALALALAVLLVWSCRAGWLFAWPRGRLFAFLGRISFSVFLLHFPVYLLLSALYVRLGFTDDLAGLGFMALAWGGSIVAANWFQREVESRKRWLPAGLRDAFSVRRR